MDHRGGADVVEVGEGRRLDLGILDRDEREQPLVAGDHVVDQLHGALLADRERRHRLGEDDRVLQRQDREDVRDLQFLELNLAHVARTWIGTGCGAVGAVAMGSTIARMPCS